MRFFRPEVERLIKMVATGVVIGAFALPLGWGYQQRREAQTWREAACAYRLRDVARVTNLVLKARHGEDSCAALRRLGLEVDLGQ